MSSISVSLSNELRREFPATQQSKSSRRLRYGAAINDADYLTGRGASIARPTCPCYASWNSMLQRSFDPKWKQRHGAYVGITVCDEWLSFMRFREWWTENHVDEWQLDKDLLVLNNKTYSPDACIYIPQWLNKFTVDAAAARGLLPIGVDLQAGGYRARCGDAISGKSLHLGYFSDSESAHSAWLSKKLEMAKELKSEMDSIDKRLYQNVVQKITEST